MTAADDAGVAGRAAAIRAETYLRLLAEAELRAAVAPLQPGTSRRRVRTGAAVRAQAMAAMERLENVAAAFAAAGAVDEQVADAVTDGLALALATRHTIDVGELGWRTNPMWRSQRPVPAPAGPFRAAALATTVRVQTCGKDARLHLLTLVLAPDKCVLTAAGQPPAPHPPRGRAAGGPAAIPFADLAATATDDKGRRYQLDQDGASWSDDGWNGAFSLQPLPPPGIAWLDLVMAAGQQPIRVRLPAEPATDPAPAAEAGAGTGRAGNAEWLVDQASDRCAAMAASPWPERGTFADLWPVIRGLQAAGILAEGSPAVARLVSLARLAGAGIPAELSQLPVAELPGRWVQAAGRHGARWHGVSGFAPAAAVLPEIGGTRCVLAGLTSGPDSATLDVLAWGWPHTHRHRPFGGIQDRFTLWARDDAGRWYSSGAASGGFSDRHAELRFELRPAPHPEARELEIILAGPDGQVSATVPLDWRPLP